MTLETAAKHIISTLKKAGYEAYFVGGCVRDRLLGLSVSDIDIATSCQSKTIQNLFPKTIPVGIKFGIIVVVESGYNFEVATFRKDKDYVDGRHPEGIESTTLEEDVKRRDFTINGLYFDPIEEKFYDFVNGKKDLNDKILKAIGDPLKRFEEDHLRMIRACRYAACLNFTIEPITKKAIIQMAPICSEGVSIERIIQELEKMHQKGCLMQGLSLMHELTLLKSIFPNLSFESDKDLKEKLQKISHVSKKAPLIFPLSILFDLKCKLDVDTLCKKFKLSNEAQKIGYSICEFKNFNNLKNIDLARLFGLEYADHLFKLVASYQSDPDSFLDYMKTKKQTLKPATLCIVNKTPILSARDLDCLHVPKGPIYKKLLDEAMSYYADHPQSSQQEVLEHIKNIMPRE